MVLINGGANRRHFFFFLILFFMLDCLMDYIGLSDCNVHGVYEQPASGIYLNSLPGISIESIDKIANSEQITYKGVWNSLQRSAAAQFRIDVTAELSRCFKLSKDCDYATLICDNLEILSQAWKYCLAVWLMHYRINSDRLNKYTTVTIQQAHDLRDFFQTEYDVSLKQAVALVDTTSCELCCGGNPEYVTYLP